MKQKKWTKKRESMRETHIVRERGRQTEKQIFKIRWPKAMSLPLSGTKEDQMIED